MLQIDQDIYILSLSYSMYSSFTFRISNFFQLLEQYPISKWMEPMLSFSNIFIIKFQHQCNEFSENIKHISEHSANNCPHQLSKKFTKEKQYSIWEEMRKIFLGLLIYQLFCKNLIKIQ